MQLLILFSVVAALISAERFSAPPIATAPLRVVVALGGMGLVWCTAWFMSQVTARALRRDVDSRQTVLRRFRRLRTVHACLWLAVCLGILFGLDWAGIVRGYWNLAHVFLADELLIVAPVLVPQMLSWAAFYDVDCAARVPGDQTTASCQGELTRAGYVALHARHYFGLLLVPLLVVLVVHDATQLVTPQLLASDRAWVVYLFALVAVGIGFPCLLRYVWDTQPLEEGPLRNRLEAMHRASEVRSREILVWRTDGRVRNAAVAGVVPWLRYVFLSDGLLNSMPDDQILAVYRHELGHVRHRHPQLRLLALVAPVALWLATLQAMPSMTAWLSATVGGWELGQGIPALLPAIGMGLYWITVFSWYSRMLELQADLSASGMDGGEPSDAADQMKQASLYVAALRTLAAWNGDAGGGGLLHPTLPQRIRFIRRMLHNPRSAARFHRGIQFAGTVLAAVVVASLIVLVWAQPG